MIAFTAEPDGLGKQAFVSSRDKGFLDLLPRIAHYARRAARHLSAEARDDLVQEVTASSFAAYTRLCVLGLADLAYASVLARYGIAQARSGRQIGNRLNCNEVLSGHAQRRKKFTVVRLDRFHAQEDAWREIAVEDRRSTPAQVAALRIDFSEWLTRLAPRMRAMAQVLSTGESTKAAAERFGVTPGRVSQLRQELKRSWENFQGEAHVNGPSNN